MKKIHLAAITLATTTIFQSASFAQNDADLFRYSKVYHGGSARFEAMGGAFGALGADISAAQINPAGLGRFSSSQFSVSIAPTINATTSDFVGQSTKDSKVSFNIPNIGIVLTKDLSGKNKGDMYSQWTFGMNRIMNYNRSTTISGQQYPSLLEDFMSQAEGYSPQELETFFPMTTFLAYESYALDYHAPSMTYYSYLNSDDVKMTRNVRNTGGSNEFFIGYSKNYLNKLYYGLTLNLRTYKNYETYTHTEDLVTVDQDFIGYDYTYILQTKGTGVNLKLGAIYLINDAFRIGASFHTPTLVSLTDKWSADMVSRFTYGTQTIAKDLLKNGEYKYRIVSPLKATISATYVIATRAILSLDVDYVNYPSAKLKSTRDITYQEYNFEVENKEAKERLTNAVNFRAGAEYNISQQYYIRGGFSYYGNAYKAVENVDKPDLGFSGGFGYRKNNIGIDIAYVNRSISTTYYPFLGSAVAENKLSSNNIILSFSVRF